MRRRTRHTQAGDRSRHRGLEGRLDEGLGSQALRGHCGGDPKIVFEAGGEPWLGVAHHDRHARRLPTDLERGFEVVDVAGRDEDGRCGVLDALLAPHSSAAKVAANDPGPAGLGAFDPIGTGVAVGDDGHCVARSAQRLDDEQTEAAEPADDDSQRRFRRRLIHTVAPSE